jgi:hypothetical protein
MGNYGNNGNSRERTLAIATTVALRSTDRVLHREQCVAQIGFSFPLLLTVRPRDSDGRT